MHLIGTTTVQCPINLIFHNSHWWGFQALPHNCSTLSFTIAAGKVGTGYWAYHTATSDQFCLLQQLLVGFSGLLITTILQQMFNFIFHHSHRQCWHTLLTLPHRDVWSPLSFKTVTGEVHGPSHDDNSEAIAQPCLLSLLLVRLAHPIENIMLQHLINLVSHYNYW